MSKKDAFSMFKKELILMGSEENRAELEHLQYVIALSAFKVIAKGRPAVSSLLKLIPSHHTHDNSKKKLVPALTFIIKPYPYQETRNPDTIKLLVRIQRQFLRRVALSKENDPVFLGLLKDLEDPDISEDDRKKSEKLVMDAVLEYGEWIGHGDLLTVKMVLEAKKAMSNSSTAFGQLAFLGPFRIQLLHMKMRKISQDYGQCMPNLINFDDVVTLPWCAALCRFQVSNKGKDIKKNDSTFEKHDQFLAAVQASYLMNMFDNYQEFDEGRLRQIKDTDDIVSYVLDMLNYFGVQFYYDPNDENSRSEDEDDMYIYCQVSIKKDFMPFQSHSLFKRRVFASISTVSALF